MTLQKAIKILSEHVDWCDPVNEVETYEALKLGVEALKYVYHQYDPDHQMMRIPLPGETSD